MSVRAHYHQGFGRFLARAGHHRQLIPWVRHRGHIATTWWRALPALTRKNVTRHCGHEPAIVGAVDHVSLAGGT